MAITYTTQREYRDHDMRVRTRQATSTAGETEVDFVGITNGYNSVENVQITLSAVEVATPSYTLDLPAAGDIQVGGLVANQTVNIVVRGF